MTDGQAEAHELSEAAREEAARDLVGVPCPRGCADKMAKVPTRANCGDCVQMLRCLVCRAIVPMA